MRKAIFGIAVMAAALSGCEWANLPAPGTPGDVSPESLERLRACESGGNYAAVSRNGSYRGAYQFSQATWNGVAQRWAPWLVGHDPAGASPEDQDNMASALFSERGRTPWPICGRRL